jgi:hypothetical protein
MSFTRIGKAADPRSSRPATGGPPSRSHPDKATQRVEVVTLPNGEAPAARLWNGDAAAARPWPRAPVAYYVGVRRCKIAEGNR